MADAPYLPLDIDDTNDRYVESGLPVRNDGYRKQGRQRGRGRGRGCLVTLGILTVALFGLVIAALIFTNFYVKPMVRDAAVEDLRLGVQEEVTTQIEAQIQDAPVGEIVISQIEINERIDATGNLGPIDDVDVVIQPAGVNVNLSAYGLSGDYDAQVVERDGAVALEGGALGGPLSFVVPEGDLEAAVNAEIANALANAGYRVESVVLGEGEMTLVLAR